MSYLRDEAPDLGHPDHLPSDPGATLTLHNLDTSGFGRIVESLRNGTIRHVVAPPPDHLKPYAAAGLRTAGLPLHEIAEVLGLSNPTSPQTSAQTQRLVDRGLALLVQHDDTHRDELRRLTSHRLDQLLSAVWAKATDPEHPQQLTASRTAADIIDRYTRLHGLNAPQEHVINAPDAERIAEIIRQVAPATQVIEADVFEVFPDAIEAAPVDAPAPSAEDVL